jgi:hypothetical protein
LSLAINSFRARHKASLPLHTNPLLLDIDRYYCQDCGEEVDPDDQGSCERCEYGNGDGHTICEECWESAYTGTSSACGYCEDGCIECPVVEEDKDHLCECKNPECPHDLKVRSGECCESCYDDTGGLFDNGVHEAWELPCGHWECEADEDSKGTDAPECCRCVKNKKASAEAKVAAEAKRLQDVKEAADEPHVRELRDRPMISDSLKGLLDGWLARVRPQDKGEGLELVRSRRLLLRRRRKSRGENMHGRGRFEVKLHLAKKSKEK